VSGGASPVLLLGAGRLGQALIQGWRRAAAFPMSELMIRTPSAKPEADAVAREGAVLNPGPADLARARTVVLCVKPQKWREAALACEGLSADAVVVSVMAAGSVREVSAGFGGRATARVIPTTAVARAAGVASVFAEDPRARAAAHALFAPVATVVDLPGEAMLDAAVGVSGSGTAYVYAFAEALERAGVAAGLPAAAAAELARATVVSSAAYLEESGAAPAELIEQVASPGGTTRAGLSVLRPGLDELLEATVAAAVRRARELAEG
jgi:pyrroline-5-carboxylate reductase